MRMNVFAPEAKPGKLCICKRLTLGITNDLAARVDYQPGMGIASQQDVA